MAITAFNERELATSAGNNITKYLDVFRNLDTLILVNLKRPTEALGGTYVPGGNASLVGYEKVSGREELKVLWMSYPALGGKNPY